MHTVRELNSSAELDQLRLTWRVLWGATRNATYFQTLDWLQIYWRHFGARQRLRVLVVESTEGPLGILPLVVRRQSSVVGNLRELTYPLDYWGSFMGPLGGNPAATLLTGLRHIAQSRRDWDLIDLRWIDTAGSDHGRTPSALHLAGLAGRRTAWTQVALVDLEAGWDAYWQGRRPRLRKNLVRFERHLNRRGPVELVRYRPLGAAVGDDNPRWDLYDQCVELARRSWQGNSREGNTLSHDQVRQFLRDQHLAAVRGGWADIALLYCDGAPVAFQYSYVNDGYVSGLRTGFDPELAVDGVGSVLMARSIADLIERGDRIFDLGPDYLPAKRPWWTRLAPSDRCLHYAAGSPRAQALRLARWAKAQMARRTAAGDDPPGMPTGKREAAPVLCPLGSEDS